MTVNGISGVNGGVQTGYSGGIMQMDSVSKSIQSQIANAQKKMQELSSNEELTIEERMKKRQEIQKEIFSLNQQLRQHQLEQRREQQTNTASVEEMLGRDGEQISKAEEQETGLSQAGMKAMLSADSSMKQAKMHGSVAVRLQGKANVLESELKLDKGRSSAAADKEEELTALQGRAQMAAEAQASALADAGRAVQETAATGTAEADTDETPEETDGTQKVQDAAYEKMTAQYRRNL